MTDYTIKAIGHCERCGEALFKECEHLCLFEELSQKTKELLRQISEQREEILTAFIAKYGCGPDECEQVVQRSPDGEKYWVRLREGEGEG